MFKLSPFLKNGFKFFHNEFSLPLPYSLKILRDRVKAKEVFFSTLKGVP